MLSEFESNANLRSSEVPRSIRAAGMGLGHVLESHISMVASPPRDLEAC